jgi:SAM-dependent methyltransferase
VTEPAGPEWWRGAFGRPYLDCYAHRDDTAGQSEVSFVVSVLGAAPGARILDAGCGAGRHVRAFAHHGMKVLGVDLSSELLAEARASGDEPYVCADVRSLPLRDASFDHAVSLFTSFGYFDDIGDRAQLSELRRVLRRGGTFVIDFLNPTYVIGSLVPTSTKTVGLYEIRESRVLRNGRVEKEVTVEDTAGGTTHRWHESVRLYGHDDLVKLLTGVGFEVTAQHGNLAGAPWSEAAERLVLAATAK